MKEYLTMSISCPLSCSYEDVKIIKLVMAEYDLNSLQNFAKNMFPNLNIGCAMTYINKIILTGHLTKDDRVRIMFKTIKE